MLDKEFYKKLLIQIRDELTKQLKDKKDGLCATIKDSSGEHSSYSFHLADQGTDTSEREKSFMIASMSSEVLREIDNSLQKIESDEYGICEHCGNDINTKRLEAIPYARLCLDCKTNDETER